MDYYQELIEAVLHATTDGVARGGLSLIPDSSGNDVNDRGRRLSGPFALPDILAVVLVLVRAGGC